MEARRIDMAALMVAMVMTTAAIMFSVGYDAGTKSSAKTTARRVNAMWVGELARRGLVSRLPSGSFKWRTCGMVKDAVTGVTPEDREVLKAYWESGVNTGSPLGGLESEEAWDEVAVFAPEVLNRHFPERVTKRRGLAVAMCTEVHAARRTGDPVVMWLARMFDLEEAKAPGMVEAWARSRAFGAAGLRGPRERAEMDPELFAMVVDMMPRATRGLEVAGTRNIYRYIAGLNPLKALSNPEIYQVLTDVERLSAMRRCIVRGKLEDVDMVKIDSGRRDNIIRACVGGCKVSSRMAEGVFSKLFHSDKWPEEYMDNAVEKYPRSVLRYGVGWVSPEVLTRAAVADPAFAAYLLIPGNTERLSQERLDALGIGLLETAL